MLIGYCFHEMGFHKVVATCDAENTASEKVMVKSGMKIEARHIKHAFINGSWRDL